ncbi:hypothetical protein PCO31110_01822 [Pandoraea communis]|uniref:Uncharacterized protein n=1 Tax=Pandoraea communis TaxID=2508297 RepID=A0A5E4U5P4_9BURK|nr:hypothetical protein PCO31110_01822 [Pandoraea communis]
MSYQAEDAASARLNADEKPATRTSTSITSVSAATIAPLYMPKKNENHSGTPRYPVTLPNW